jgi:O-antigen/teichoic acid export membrane protein
MRLNELIVMDGLISVSQIGGLYVLWKLGRLGAVTAFAAIALANGLVFVWFVYRLGRFKFQWRSFWPHFRDNYHFARWVLSGSVAMFGIAVFYRWWLGLTHGLEGVAVLTAILSVVMFGNPIILGLANYIGPETAAAFARGGHVPLVRSVVRSTLVLLAVVVGLMVLLVALGPWVLSSLFQSVGVLRHREAVWVLGAGVFAEQLLTPIECGYMAMGSGRVLFFTAALRCLIAVTAGAFFVYWWGPMGMGLGMLLASGLALAWQWIIFLRLGAEDV